MYTLNLYVYFLKKIPKTKTHYSQSCSLDSDFVIEKVNERMSWGGKKGSGVGKLGPKTQKSGDSCVEICSD